MFLRVFERLLLAAGLWIVTASPSQAMTLRPLSFDQIRGYADRIVDATCVSNEIRPDSEGRIFYRYTTFHAHETFKGAHTDTVIIRVASFGDTIARSWGIPVFAPGDRAVIFLTPPNRDGYPYLVGVGMGCYHVTGGMVRQHSAPPAPSPSVGGLEAGRFVPSTTLENLRAMIRETSSQ